MSSATPETWWGVVKYPARHKEVEVSVVTTRAKAPDALRYRAASEKGWPLSELVLDYWRCASPPKEGEVEVG